MFARSFLTLSAREEARIELARRAILTPRSSIQFERGWSFLPDVKNPTTRQRCPNGRNPLATNLSCSEKNTSSAQAPAASRNISRAKKNWMGATTRPQFAGSLRLSNGMGANRSGEGVVRIGDRGENARRVARSS